MTKATTAPVFEETERGICHRCGADIPTDLDTCGPCGRDYDSEQAEDLDRRIPWPGREP